jgi:hypothetical protein
MDSAEMKRLHREEIFSVTPDSASSSTHVLTPDDLPPGYYWSKNFIGSVAGVCLMAISLYLGYVLPVWVSNAVTVLPTVYLTRPRQIL